jgi:hypothetical protein
MSRHNNFAIDKTVQYGRFKAGITWRSSKSIWGRFGGGWQWKLGFQASRTIIIISLLVMEIRLSWWEGNK